MKTLIQGGWVVGHNGREHEIIEGGVVVVEDERIAYVGDSFSEPVDRRIEAPGRLVSPGLINTHLHARTNASDHVLNDIGRPEYLGRNYLSSGSPLRGRRPERRPEDVWVGGRFALLEALKAGSTTILEIGTVGGNGEEFVKMAGELGVRAYLSPQYRSADFLSEPDGRIVYDLDEERGRQGLRRAVDFIERHHGSYGDRIRGMLYPGQIDTCTPELLKDTRAQATRLGVGIELHAAMNVWEFHEIMRRHRQTPIELLASLDFLAPDVLLGHCVFVAGYEWLKYPYGDDLKLIADAGATVAHSPLKYGKQGITMHSFQRYLDRGIRMTIGTDTFPRDIITELRYTALFCRIADENYMVGKPRDVYNAATVAGAAALGRDDIGRLVPGARADIIVVNLDHLHAGAILDPIKTLVECSSGRDVELVMVDGQTLVENGRAVAVDEADLLAQVRRLSREEWDGVPLWDWAGRRPEEMVPLSFPMRVSQAGGTGGSAERSPGR